MIIEDNNYDIYHIFYYGANERGFIPLVGGK